MTDASINVNYEARFDQDDSRLEFLFEAASGDALLASTRSADVTTVKAWLAQIESGATLTLPLMPHTFMGSDTSDGPVSDFVLSGTILASFCASGVDYTVPANDFADIACRLLSRYSVTEFKVFVLFNLLSPTTADRFADALINLNLEEPPSRLPVASRRIRPTILTKSDEILSDERVVWLFKDQTRAVSLRQLEEFLPMKMQHLKPHLQRAGILPTQPINTRNIAVTTGVLLARFIPYIEENQNDPFLRLLGLLRDHGIVAVYQTPPRR